jgi:hypothetical protein
LKVGSTAFCCSPSIMLWQLRGHPF